MPKGERKPDTHQKLPPHVPKALQAVELMTGAQEKCVEANVISLPQFSHPAISLQSFIHPFTHICLFSLRPMKPTLPSPKLCKHVLQILFMQAVRHWPVLFMRKVFFLAAGATQTFDNHKMALIF